VYTRVVRFTGVDAERMKALNERIEADGGPPPGVELASLVVLFDESQGTAVVLQHFASAEAMQSADKIFGAMDAGETPGTRASVDMCEVELELKGP